MIEYDIHYLPDNGPRRDCWILIQWGTFGPDYHSEFYYSTSKETGWAFPEGY